jgi:hypothetical protein
MGIELTLEQWREEGKRLFGDDVKKWEFVCPACGHVSNVQQFLDIGAEVDDAYNVCIGRKNGKGEDGMKGKDKGNGCNWAAYGLFGTLSKGITVLTPKGDKTDVFDFHKKEMETDETSNN